MMRLIRELALLLAVIFMASSGFADTDYVCLKNCMDSGGVAHTCLTNCTYDATPPASAHPKEQDKKQSHKLFDAPKPADGVVFPAPGPIKSGPDKDYDCMNKCLQSHMQYEMCNQRCIHAKGVVPGN